MHPCQWMASVDLKDAYIHIKVVSPHHQYLRFSWQGQSYQFKVPFRLSLAPLGLHQDLGSPGDLAPAHGCAVIPIPRRRPHSRGVASRGRAVYPDVSSGAHSSRVHCEPQEVRPDPCSGSGSRGQVPDGPQQRVFAGGMNRRASSPCQILLQSRAVQTSSPLLESHGIHLAVGRVHPPSHASHPVVFEVTEPCNPRIAIHDPQ